MEHFYVIDRELVGFYYVPYAGSAPILDLHRNLLMNK